MLSYLKNVYSPTGTTRSTFPSAEVNFAFINDIVRSITSGSGSLHFDAKAANKALQKDLPGAKPFGDSPPYVINKPEAPTTIARAD